MIWETQSALSDAYDINVRITSKGSSIVIVYFQMESRNEYKGINGKTCCTQMLTLVFAGAGGKTFRIHISFPKVRHAKQASFTCARQSSDPALRLLPSV